MDNFKILIRLYRQYAKMDLLWFLRDTRYFFIQLVSDVVSGGCTIAGVCLLSANFKNFSGMTQNEVLFMMGYALFIDGIFMVFFMGNNTGMVSRIIGRGQLDHIMIQPVPLWAELLAQGFSPVSGSPIMIFGIGLTAYGAIRAGLPINAFTILLFLFYSICSIVIVMSFIYLISCSAFYAPAAAEEIAGVGKELFSSLKTYPLGNMKGFQKHIFLSLIPVGLCAWLPSTLLIKAGKYGLEAVFVPEAFYLPIAAAIFSFIAIITFKKGMNYYETYGSPRYSGFGHR
ncbi:ABC-2 family transporter protein [Lacrimispora xylanisolvens]|uniref:ABC-2 family transporter protein n=1 Tax=Lacrimispora xylanisolvens TaxID=384636 RepID=UPI001FA85E0A|nr:ABC-2 family transporter protein [Hungatella xylanolytica]